MLIRAEKGTSGLDEAGCTYCDTQRRDENSRYIHCNGHTHEMSSCDVRHDEHLQGELYVSLYYIVLRPGPLSR